MDYKSSEGSFVFRFTVKCNREMAGYYPREVTIGDANTAVGELVLHMQVLGTVKLFCTLIGHFMRESSKSALSAIIGWYVRVALWWLYDSLHKVTFNL